MGTAADPLPVASEGVEMGGVAVVGKPRLVDESRKETADRAAKYQTD